LTVGTNISETTVGGELTSLNSNLTSLEDEVDSIGTATSTEETEPYLFKSSARENVVGNIMSVHKIIGGTVAWNQLYPKHTGHRYSGTALTVSVDSDGYVVINGTSEEDESIQLTTGPSSFPANHVGMWIKDGSNNIAWGRSGFGSYIIRNAQIIKHNENFNGYVVIKTGVGKTYNNDKIRFMLFDLTQMFGTTIADYIYSLEQATAGAGVAFFRNLFPNDYYPDNVGELISVKTSAHVMRDANNNIIGNYPLEPDLELRGIPKLDSNNKLYYDGDEYTPSGNVQRRYEKRAYQSGDESLADAITDGTNTVVKLATPTTETADSYDKQQVFDVTGTEEYVDTRTIPIPVGHDTFFPTSLTSRIDALEDEFDEEITALSESIAPTETGTATQNYATGSYLMLNNRLCKVTSAIATGEQIIVGSNVQYTTVAEELTAILAQINA
jgi:hypothetical protein